MDDHSYDAGSVASTSASPMSSSKPLQKKKKAVAHDSDPNEPPKKKRKQLVACDSCRLRRVKCNKGDVGDADCSECVKKAIKCTDEYVKTKPRIVRTGKLIQQAKLLFGAGQENGSEIPPAPGRGPLGIDGLLSSNQEYPPQAGTSSAPPGSQVILATEARVVSAELARAISSHLIDLYHEVMTAYVGIPWDRFSAEWDASGRNSDRLSPSWKLCAMVMQAWASRFSDHPAIVHGAPKFSDLDRRHNKDLTQFGLARDSFCQVMMERALRTVDETGALRRPSGPCGGALVLLEWLVSWEDLYRVNGRHLMSAATEHLRCRVDGCTDDPGDVLSQQDKVSGGPLFWMIYTRDSFSAAFGGHMPHLTLEDVTLCCALLDNPILLDIHSQVTSSDPTTLGGLTVIAVFRQISVLARTVASEITGPLARRRSLDLRTVQNLWDLADQSAHYVSIWESHVNSVDWSKSPMKKESHWFRDAATLRAQIIHAIHINITDRLDIELRRPPGPDLPYAYIDQLQRLKVASSVRLLAVCREVAGVVRHMLPSALFVACLSCENLKSYLRHMIEMPTWEQGGPQNWTLADKSTEVSWMMDAVQIFGWCFPSARLAIIEAEACLNHLNALNTSALAVSSTRPQLPPLYHSNSSHFDSGSSSEHLHHSHRQQQHQQFYSNPNSATASPDHERQLSGKSTRDEEDWRYAAAGGDSRGSSYASGSGGQYPLNTQAEGSDTVAPHSAVPTLDSRSRPAFTTVPLHYHEFM